MMKMRQAFSFAVLCRATAPDINGRRGSSRFTTVRLSDRPPAAPAIWLGVDGRGLVGQELVAITSTADFNCDASNATKPEGMCASRRKVYDSTVHERAAIIYSDDDGSPVADVCYPNHCSER